MSFIQKIHIKHVRHLKNLTIELDDKKKINLILTGKNGSGKTSVLLAMQSFLRRIEEVGALQQVNSFKSHINELHLLLNNSKSEEELIVIKRKVQTREKILYDYGQGIELSIPNMERYASMFLQGKFIVAYFPAKRLNSMQDVGGAKRFKDDDKIHYSSKEKANKYFLQYLVNLKTERSFSKDDNDIETVQKIDHWFNQFQQQLQQLFSDPTLELKFDRKNYTFYFQHKGHERFDFSTLSDGYAAIMDIVTELIMRMNQHDDTAIYNFSGIVMIDELETHLHLALQKQVLPFLTTLFPYIQFIVTTHSPFVLNSIADAVVYDLEYQEAIPDLSSYTYDALVESYFEQDKYSNLLKNKVEEYANLLKAGDYSESLRQELLLAVQAPLADELRARFYELEIERTYSNGSN
ncbi:MAG: AAA family ATPase [Mariprofundales bacterium]